MTYQMAKDNFPGKMAPITMDKSLTVKNMVKVSTNFPKAKSTMVFSNTIFSMVLANSN